MDLEKEKESVSKDIEQLEKEISIVDRQIENSDYNITGLIAQKTRHMDRRDSLEQRKSAKERDLQALEKGGTD